MQKENLPESSDISLDKKGPISNKLSEDGIQNESLDSDHIGIEIISVAPSSLYEAVSARKQF